MASKKTGDAWIILIGVFKLLKGTECDILADRRLDYDDEVLASFDYVVASVHSHFGQSAEQMTARVVRALSHPRVTMLGHATGRLLLRRDAYKVDLEAVLQTAAKHKKMIDRNSTSPICTNWSFGRLSIGRSRM